MKAIVILNDERQTVKTIDNVLEIRNYNDEIEIEYVEFPLIKLKLNIEIKQIKDIQLSEFISSMDKLIKYGMKQ